MKNIAIIVPTLNKGGAERVAANMSIEFAKHYNVYIIVYDGSDIIYPYGGQLIDLRLPPAKNIFGKITTLLKRICILRKIKKDYQIDIAISHLPSANLANVISRRSDIIFTYIHSMKVNVFKEKILSFFSDKVICVSECVRNMAINQCGIRSDKVITVYNFCDLEKPINKITKTNENSILIVNMGRLSEPKGQWHLIRALKKVLCETDQNVKLAIIGDGEKRPSLEKLTEQLGINENVQFTGFMENPWDFMVNADIYVSSSIWEGMPMALVEAGRCGLPIISTDCDAGCREILAPNTSINKKAKDIELAEYGILIPVCFEGTESQTQITAEEEIMSKAIIRMINNISMRNEYAVKAQIRSEDFRCENIMKQWDILINTSLGKDKNDL